ncbi:stomatin-like protein 1 [Terrapene carolina triunguis]|uniref:stomatin-like protein 1 n=1 Tax=Terrapene triunguis TaxID=2587831 RepID=UPI000CEFECE5|nr:stomatin-like protein 1 [Terrapene carolina triunguis]
MFSWSGYQALPLGDFDRFQQSSIGVYGSQKSLFCFGHMQDPWDQVPQMKGSSQGWLSWICHGIVTSLAFLLMVITFPVSGWFVLKLTSKDGAVISMGADIQFRVWDPVLSVMMVKDLNAATRMMAQNAMTKTLLKKNLREIQTEKLWIGDQLLLEINDMTKSWGLEVDRVELILEAVLQPSQESLSGHLTMTPPIPGFEGLDSTIQQLAAHFFSNSMAPGAPDPIFTPLSPADSVVTVNEAEPPAPTITTTSSSNRRKPSPEELLSAVELFLSESLVGAVGASYQFNIILLSGARSTYFIDLTAGSGRIGLGDAERNPDVILEMTENDLQSFFSGELHPLSAYMSGRLRVKGDLSVALKLEELFKAMKQHR